MTGYIEALYRQMEEALLELATEPGSFLQRAEKSFHIVESSLSALREYIHNYTFKDEEEEILFFKHFKPRFHKELIFWAEVIRIEAGWPAGTMNETKQYRKKMLKDVQSYFARHHFLYEYHRLGRTHLDHVLYVRDAPYTPLLPTDASDLDSLFSTVAGNIRTGIIAREEVITWLNDKMQPADTGKMTDEPPGLVWTGSQAQFVELVYALESYGVFNNGKTNVKEVMSYLQHCFKVDKVTNFYGYFQKMRLRKKDRTPFLNGLTEHIIRRMDESDEFPRFS